MTGRVISGVLAVLMLAGLVGSASAQSIDSSGTQIRTIRTLFIVERRAQNSRPQDPSYAVSLRASPLIAIANRFFFPIGYRVESAGIIEVDSIPGTTLRDALQHLRSSSGVLTSEIAYDTVVGILDRPREGAEVGFAFPETACDLKNAFLALSWIGDGASEVEQIGRTFTHELGHAVGAWHDARSVINGLFSIMHPRVLALTAGFSDISRNEIDSFLAKRAAFGDCVPERPLVVAAQSVPNTESLAVAEGETLRWSVQMAAAHGPVFARIDDLPPGASFSVPDMTLTYAPGFDTVAPGAAERVFTLKLRVEEFTGEVVGQIPLTVRSALPLLRFADGAITVIRAKSGRHIHYRTRVVGAEGSRVRVSCSAAPHGLRTKVERARFDVSGRVRAGGTIVCDASNGSAAGRKVIVFDVPAQVRSRAAR